MGVPGGRVDGNAGRPRQLDTGWVGGDPAIEKELPFHEPGNHTRRPYRSSARDGHGAHLPGEDVADANRPNRDRDAKSQTPEHLG